MAELVRDGKVSTGISGRRPETTGVEHARYTGTAGSERVLGVRPRIQRAEVPIHTCREASGTLRPLLPWAGGSSPGPIQSTDDLEEKRFSPGSAPRPGRTT